MLKTSSILKKEKSNTFLFNDKYCFRFLDNRIWMRYRWNDDSFFISFSSEDKTFRESLGFGISKESKNNWWMMSCCKWFDLQ